MAKRPQRIKIDDNLYKRGDVYIYRRADFEETLGEFPNDKAAKEYKRIFESMRDHIGAAAFKLRVKDVWPMYEKEREDEATIVRPGRKLLSPRTLKETKDIYRLHLRPFFGNKKLSEIDDVLWNTFCKKSRLNDLSNARKVFGHFCRWCKASGKMRVLPEFKIPDHERRERRVVTQDQIRAMVSNSDGTLLLFISMYLFMGVRRGEQVRLKWDAVDLESRSLEIRAETSRTRNRREVPINAYVHAQLVERRRQQAEAGIETPWVFPKRGAPDEHMTESGIQKAWHTMLKNSGLKDLGIEPHDLRATFEHFAHLRADFTDTQREKMAGASIEVQRKIYLRAFGADQLRGLEEVVQVDGVNELISAKLKQNTGKTRGKDAKK